MNLAEADIVPTDTNLADEYAGFADLEAACRSFMATVNGRVHRTTKRVPADMLEQERLRLHPIPALPHTVTFGETRTVAVNTPMVSYQGGSYLVPHTLLGETVWVRMHGAGRDERVVIVHVGDRGAIEVARHARAEPGSGGAVVPSPPGTRNPVEPPELRVPKDGWFDGSTGATSTERWADRGSPP